MTNIPLLLSLCVPHVHCLWWPLSFPAGRHCFLCLQLLSQAGEVHTIHTMITSLHVLVSTMSRSGDTELGPQALLAHVFSSRYMLSNLLSMTNLMGKDSAPLECAQHFPMLPSYSQVLSSQSESPRTTTCTGVLEPSPAWHCQGLLQMPHIILCTGASPKMVLTAVGACCDHCWQQLAHVRGRLRT